MKSNSLTLRHPAPALFIAQEQHYYPFGLPLTGAAVTTQPAEAISKLQYNGGSTLEDELTDAESANYATPYRRYDPALGRLLGVDPLAHKYADLSTGNYAFNDPVNFNDPSGTDALGDWAVATAALTGGPTLVYAANGDGDGGRGEHGGGKGGSGLWNKPHFDPITGRDNYAATGYNPGNGSGAGGGGYSGGPIGSLGALARPALGAADSFYLKFTSKPMLTAF